MANYANPTPRDKGGSEMQEWPAPIRASVVSVSDNAVASSVISLQPNTTQIEVSAVGGGAVIRWVPLTETAAAAGPKASVVASGLGANFDHHIPAGQLRQFVVPRETQGIGTGTLQVGSTYGLYQRVATINASSAPASVIIVQFGGAN